MFRRKLNLGIVAHVDAGKTTLTERLLYEAGVIDEIGSVDSGTTQTDTLALERQRGITIRAAVASFAIDDVLVNLIDTPGHPDFIAEVERVLNVLDGAVVVISGVEGVQPQTRILMRALQRLRIPTLLFVNKMDRTGADAERTLRSILDRLTPAAVPLDERLAEALAERSDGVLEALVDGRPLTRETLWDELAAQTRRAAAYPVFVGSAVRGEGVDALRKGLVELLPAAAGDPDAPVSGSVFKIERGAKGDRIAYIRMFSGTVHVREPLGDEKVTALNVFQPGGDAQRPSVAAGEIAKLWGLGDVRIGDRIGDAPPPRHEFAPPTLESVVVPVSPDDGARLRVALEQLAEQDPLIDVRQHGNEMSVSLYGEVQKEVVEATLANDYGLAVEFRETTPICVERPTASGEALEILNAETNPFSAEIGLRIDPAREDSGVEVLVDVDPRTVPLYVYKTMESFREHMDRYVRDALGGGLFGWRVVDCVVTMTRCGYAVADGPPSRRGPTSTAADFRKLAPIVVREALEEAGTVVCEPTVDVRLEIPADVLGTVIPALARLGAAIGTPSIRGALATVETVVSTRTAQELQRQLAGLTGGEGVLESTFAGYRAVTGASVSRTG